ncbi:MAG TPA: tetratricopeptide repeat protein [Phototrophicaceae bacterium]|nr:tetratricopeptide repeat protein [Phototrophicaceae bacterium]
MSDEQARYFVNLLDQIKMPDCDFSTEAARQIYDEAHDVLLMYRGHPDTLMKALQGFVATGVRPYIYAGMARIVLLASYISSGKYDQWGVKQAAQLLQQAQRYASGYFEIDMIEPEIYNLLGQLETMRLKLDNLRRYVEAQTSFRFALLELWYWENGNNLDTITDWCRTAFERAETGIQRLYALNNLASTYMNRQHYQEALGVYQQLVKIDPQDPWAWHNMSWIYLNIQDYASAGACNRRALDNMEFEAARTIQKKLVEMWSKSRLPDILDDVPQYVSVEQAAHTKEKNGLWGRLIRD